MQPLSRLGNRNVGFGAPAWATLLLLIFGACSRSPDPIPSVETDAEAATAASATEGSTARQDVETWRCRNDLEILCHEGKCEATEPESFTPASVEVSSDGAVSVCLYSGCWEGRGDVAGRPEFLILVGHDLAFSTAPDSPSQRQDLVVIVDRADGIGTLKAGEFALPLLCAQPS